MADITSVDLARLAGEQLESASPDLLRAMVKAFAEALMGAEADAVCGAPYGQVSEDRVNYRNGYRDRRWDTRAGTIELAIPRLRAGSYFPEWLLERRRRSEQALVSVVATSYLLGVSTRRVEKLAETLGIKSLSKSQVSELAKSLDGAVEQFRSRPLDGGPYRFVQADALTLRVREGGRTVLVHGLIATGVNEDGHREILGFDVTSAEDGAGWLAFFRGLVARGLSGVALVTSDAHAGLVAAIAATLPGASWQRCKLHFARNLTAAVPKGHAGMAAAAVRTIFAQPDAAGVRAQLDTTAGMLGRQFPKVETMLRDAAGDITAFAGFPPEHRKKIWGTNGLERTNKDIKRRTGVAGVFPNPPSLLRLAGAVLAEIHDEWQVSDRRLFSEASMAKLPGPPAGAQQASTSSAVAIPAAIAS